MREFGRGTSPDPSQACGNCGNCGHRRAAILPDGTVAPCPLTRWMHGGNVLDAPLADTVGTVTEMAAARPGNRDCNPTCIPGACKPNI